MNGKQHFFGLTLGMFLTTICACSNNSDSDTNAESDITNELETEVDSGADTDSEVLDIDYTDGHGDTSDYAWDSSSVVDIVLDQNAITANGEGVTIEGSIATITAAGNYSVSGTLLDGQIIVDIDDDEAITRLILDGVDMSSSTTSPLFVKSSEQVVIILSDNSYNYISDAEEYVYDNVEEDEPNAAIFSKDDLSIYGNGLLAVSANYNDGIKSKDGLVLNAANLTVNSVDDGIVGKDYVHVEGGEMTLNVVGDGLKSTNEDADKGYVFIEGGKLNITSGADSIQAESNLKITNGEFSLVSGGGSNASISDDDSAKGLKASMAIFISDGEFVINSADDAIHSNNTVQIDGGVFDIATGDDGIHADTLLGIAGGDITITESYEGIESAEIIVDAGTVRIVSSDDGLNVAGGNDGDDAQQGPGGRPGQDNFSSGDYFLTMNGGTIVIDADGDGVDVNGTAEMTGGSIIVNGPTSNGNGALDYDGAFNISGGMLVAAGSSGMAQAPSSTSTQNSLLLTFNSSLTANTLFHIQTQAGEEVLSFAPSKSYSSLVFSSSNLKKGSSYNVYYGGSSTGTESNGLYEGGVYSPGTLLTTFTVDATVTR